MAGTLNRTYRLNRRSNQFWVFLLLFFSGNPISFVSGIEYLRLAVSVGLFAYTFVDRKAKYFVPTAKWFYGLVCVIFLLQIYHLSYFSYPAAVNILSKWFLGLFVIRKVGVNFRITYLKVMYFISIMSFIGMFFSILGYYPGVSVNEDKYLTIFFHNIHNTNNASFRNSGMFWEPGAFQGYLIMVPLLFIDNLALLWRRYRKHCLVLLAALLSTFSTTGYIAFAVILFYYVAMKLKSKFARILLVPVLFLALLYAYTSLDFLGEKIDKQIERATSGNVTVDRLGSAILDWHYIKKNPITGNGLADITRYEDHLMYKELIGGFSNGFTDVVAKFGIIFIIVYFVLIYKNLPFRPMDKLFFCCMIVLLLQGEYFMDYPLFAALPFIVINTQDISVSINRKYRFK